MARHTSPSQKCVSPSQTHKTKQQTGPGPNTTNHFRGDKPKGHCLLSLIALAQLTRYNKCYGRTEPVPLATVMPKASQKVLWSKLIKSRFGLLELVRCSDSTQSPLRCAFTSHLIVSALHRRPPNCIGCINLEGAPSGPPPHKQGPEARATNHEDRTDVFAPTRDPDTEQPNKDRPS